LAGENSLELLKVKGAIWQSVLLAIYCQNRDYNAANDGNSLPPISRLWRVSLNPIEHPMIGKGGSKDADYGGASLPEE